MTLYTSPTCAYCPMVKKYLAMKGVEYEEKDITDTKNLQELYDITKMSSVPVVVEGDRFAIGVNYGQIAELCTTA